MSLLRKIMRDVWPLPKIEFQSLAEIEERRPALLVTSPPAWRAVGSHLNLSIAAHIEVGEATRAHWDHLLSSIESRDLEVVYAVGGGLPADASKYLAVKLGLPLICLPSALSVDAFFTWASGIREDGCVYYQETKPPDTLIVDFDIIAAAPESIRAAGICDVLSIATGAWDWKFAEELGKNPQGMEFVPWIYDNAQSILRGALDCAKAAGLGDPAGLKQLCDCLALEVQLCNQISHSRPEEGSEHYFAYCAENLISPAWPHADLLGLGILIMAQQQGQDVAPLERALRCCNIPLDRLSRHHIEETLRQLPNYVQHHNLPYGIAHERRRK